MLYPLLHLRGQAPAPKPKRRHTCWVKPWIQQREDRGAYINIMQELYETDIPGFRNLMRMTPGFFEMLKERSAPGVTKQTTNCGPQDCGPQSQG